jgi:hypothetical protein
MSEMPRTLNAKQARPDAKAILFTTLWVLLLIGAMLFIALAGHI